jgi:phage FluMu protein Com
VQTCSLCKTQSPDDALFCNSCNADLAEFSTTAVTLKKLLENPRVKAIRIIVGIDACPTCQQLEGTYSKNDVPKLPVVGCSHDRGCKCYYEPVLDEIYP